MTKRGLFLAAAASICGAIVLGSTVPAMAISPAEPPIRWAPTFFNREEPSHGDPASDASFNDKTTTPETDSVGEFTVKLESDALEKSISVTLLCDPDGGTYPGDVASVCKQLTVVDGVIESIPSAHLLCTKEYKPVTASVTGFWSKKVVSYSASFSNACEANAATGGKLFNFWSNA